MGKEELENFRVYIAEYQTKLTKKYKARKSWVRPNPNHILVQIPGTILNIQVKEKQHVKAGETLLILEAMKMENQILMPFDGQITSIHVEEGDKVSKNYVMIEIKP